MAATSGGSVAGGPIDTCPWDLDGNDWVNPIDMGLVMSHFGCAVGEGDPVCDAMDLDGNGVVNPIDSGLVGSFFGGCPHPVTLTLAFEGLETLGEGYVYEGWIIVDGAPVSTGRFNVDENGDPVPADFLIDEDDAENAALFVLTIEPAIGDDPAPSATHVLAGPFAGDVADLSIGHPAALGDDFGMASGSFILATPSTADIEEDYDQGIWFLDPDGGPGPSLNLPMLPAGWAYEGWVVDVGGLGPISTGRFTSVIGADSDGTGPDAGPDPGPPFPGQDFIDPPLVLTGLVAVISVEPDPDDSPAPFAIKPLIDMNIEDIPPPTLQSMANTSENAPTGTATFEAQPVTKTIELTFDGLEDLGPDFVYEGWLIVDGAPVSTGRFNINENGEPDHSMFEVAMSDINLATLFVLTIEPAVGDVPAPADTHILAGPFDGTGASITIDHAAALGTDFSSATGAYILATPSTADIDEDYDQGIWFVDPAGGPGPSLDLPTLPAGWAYEGWVVGPGGPMTTGRFVSVTGEDSDGTGPYAGPDPGPPFPGQDYIDPPMVLIAYAAVITVEPEPDNSPMPFTLKPLIDTNIEDVPPPTLQSMVFQETAPTGLVTVIE